LKLLFIYRVPILILLVTFGFIAPLLIRLSNLIPKITSEFNNTPTATIGLSITPQQNLTPTESFTPTPLLTEITDDKGVSMMLVPAGEFTFRIFSTQIILSPFYIDKYEVTNKYYNDCVESGGCQPPKYNRSYKRFEYFGIPEFEDYPVVWVDWHMANDFCNWRGARLPTNAEWEKAAGGTDERKYPWGDSLDCAYANFADNINNKSCVGDTAQVGTYDKGISPYGAYDMGGNVWEWVADWSASPNEIDGYKPINNSIDPQGPLTGGSRVLRGGSFMNGSFVSLYSNSGWDPSLEDTDIGFRCARSVP